MQSNKNGIPVHTPRKQHKTERPSHKFELVKFTSMVEGYEVAIVIPSLSPLKKLAQSSGWNKVKYEDR